jgi:hypothetical protein
MCKPLPSRLSPGRIPGEGFLTLRPISAFAASTTVVVMSNISSNDRIDEVAAGDLVNVDRGSGEKPYKVVHKDAGEGGGVVVTFEDDDGETFQVEYAAGDIVTRSLQAKWESTQSPTPHNPNTP